MSQRELTPDYIDSLAATAHCIPNHPLVDLRDRTHQIGNIGVHTAESVTSFSVHLSPHDLDSLRDIHQPHTFTTQPTTTQTVHVEGIPLWRTKKEIGRATAHLQTIAGHIIESGIGVPGYDRVFGCSRFFPDGVAIEELRRLNSLKPLADAAIAPGIFKLGDNPNPEQPRLYFTPGVFIEGILKTADDPPEAWRDHGIERYAHTISDQFEQWNSLVQTISRTDAISELTSTQSPSARDSLHAELEETGTNILRATREVTEQTIERYKTKEYQTQLLEFYQDKGRLKHPLAFDLEVVARALGRGFARLPMEAFNGDTSLKTLQELFVAVSQIIEPANAFDLERLYYGVRNRFPEETQSLFAPWPEVVADLPNRHNIVGYPSLKNK